ncbi:hypothetical protein HYX19_01480 [Candidatus Woesearchaeota archaeon]|nr:hypothetical protein [Candidatus Woesearchaeota archaeon]
MATKFKQSLSSLADTMYKEAGKMYLEAIKLQGLAQETSRLIKEDTLETLKIGEKKIEGLISQMSENEQFKEIGRAVFDNAEQGYEKTKDAVRSAYGRCNARLNELVQEKPGLVGFIDGFVSAYLATPVTRRPKSQTYSTHTKYGRGVGFVTAATTFYAGGSVLGSLPVTSRITRYLKDKVHEAKGNIAEKKVQAN